MSFGENLQESRSHHALLRLQETEIKLLENIRNCVKLRIKSDQDYAKSLQTIIVQSQKFENPEFTGPTFDVWNKVVKETGNLIKQIQSCSDNLQKETFEKLTILINERKASKKSFSDERCRLDSEVKKLQDTVQRNKDEYSKVVGRVREERVKYEALFEKGKAGGKFEDAKTKYLKAEGKLHTAHNDYILSLHELELYQQQYLTTLLPGLLNFQETVQQSNIAQTKDILIEYGKLTDSTAEEFACIHKEIKTELEKIDPSTEYNHFIDGNKSDPLTIDALVFDENLLEDYRGNIIPAQLAFNDLSHEAMLRKRTLFEDKLAQAEADTKVYEDELEGIQGEIADLVNQSTEDNNMKKNDLNVKRRAEDILQRKIGELKCSIERFRSLYDYANAEIEKAGEELPKGLDLPDLNSDASPTQDVSDASVAGGSSGLKGTLHKLKNKMTKKPPAMPTPLPSKDKLHARHSVAASEEGDTMENRPPPPLPVEEKEVSIVNESRDAEVTNEIDTTTNNHIELRHSVVIPDGTSLLMTTDITRSVTEEDWFHGVLPREEVQKLLEVDGDYLVRESKNKQTGQMQYVLSMRSKGAPKHFIIQGQDGSWRFEGQTFPTIQELIIHQHQSGKPVTSRTQAILERPVLREEWELKNDDIKVIKKIGNGNFGDVFKGTYAGEEVAIKTCKDTLSDEQKKKFLMEGRILKQYDHPNIVRFIGIATHKQPIMIVMEYMAGGSLLTHLRRVGDSLQTQQLIRFCEDAASGMAYLEQKCCIHRDLAARNCLIAKPSNDIKISDFGMSREEEEYTVSDGLKQIPIKWTAPEALNYGKYTSMCDIWSYGILMWEIFSGGKTPYQGWNNTKSREMVEDGYRLPNPEGCPELIYALMLKAWEYDPDKRPHFDQIYRELQSIRNRLC